MQKRILALVLIAAGALVGTALASPIIGLVTAETARGELDQRLQVNTRFDNGARVKLNTKGPIEIIMQRVVVPPGGSLGWHTHPGENVNVVAQGTLTLYHARKCTMAMPYGVGDSFATHPKDVHLARNEGTGDVVFFATYFAPKATPALPVRIDQPSPGPGCPL